jgi:hypothetical protein
MNIGFRVSCPLMRAARAHSHGGFIHIWSQWRNSLKRFSYRSLCRCFAIFTNTVITHAATTRTHHSHPARASRVRGETGIVAAANDAGDVGVLTNYAVQCHKIAERSTVRDARALTGVVSLMPRAPDRVATGDATVCHAKRTQSHRTHHRVTLTANTRAPAAACLFV